MIEIKEYLDCLFARVAKRIERDPSQLQPFIKILKENWYESEEDLLELKDEDFNKMKIPMRVANAIREQIKERIGSTECPQMEQSEPERQKKAPLNQDTMLHLAHQLQMGLLQQCNNNGPEVLEHLKRILKIVGNIIQDSYEVKFRTLKKSNAKICSTFYEHRSCMSFMKAIGFVNQGETLYLHTPETHQLYFIQQCLNQIIDKLENNKKETRARQKQQMPSTEEDLQKKFAPDELERMNYAEGLQKLIEFRNKLMEKPPTDRKIRIYHKRFENKEVQNVGTSFESQLEVTDDQVIANYWKQFVTKNKHNSAFQSKRKLEFEFLLKQKIHKETVIKIKLPNELILEGCFGPLQKLSDVFKFVAEIIIGDLYLYTSPPVVKMKKELEMTLDALDCVPSGSFFLGINGDWYIKNEYSTLIQK